MGFGLMVRTFETPLERRQHVPKRARHKSLFRLDIVRTFFARKHAQQILAAHDSDHLPVPHHGHALDPMCSEQTRDLTSICVLVYRDDRP
jgi:hypothetical protein